MLFDNTKKFHVLNSLNGKTVYSTNDEDDAGRVSDKHTNGSGVPHMVTEALFTSSKATTVVRRPVIPSSLPETPRVVVRLGDLVIDPSALEEKKEKIQKTVA